MIKNILFEFRKKEIYNILGLFFLRFVGLFLSFLLNIYLARLLDKDTLGVYFFLTQIIIILSVIFRLGLDVSILKYGAYFTKSNFLSAIKIYIGRSIIPFALLFLMATFFSLNLLNNDYFKSIIFIGLSVIPYATFNLVAELLKSQDNQQLATLLQTICLPGLLIIILALFDFDIFFTYILSMFFIAIISIFLAVKIYLNLKKEGIRSDDRIFLEGKHFLLIAILNVLMSSLDIFMLGVLSDQSNVADYGLALRLVSISSVILIMTNGLIGPHYSNLWKKNRIVELKEHFSRLCIFMAGVALATLMTFFIFGELMLEILYGPKYVEIFSLLNILSLGQAVVLATGPVAFMLMMSDSMEKHKISLLIALLLNIILNIMLIPSYGAIGAAIATAASLICKNIYSFNSVYKKFFSDKIMEKYEQ